jgi:hypothetical protein
MAVAGQIACGTFTFVPEYTGPGICDRIGFLWGLLFAGWLCNFQIKGGSKNSGNTLYYFRYGIPYQQFHHVTFKGIRQSLIHLPRHPNFGWRTILLPVVIDQRSGGFKSFQPK